MFDRIVNGILNEDLSSILSKEYNLDAAKARKLISALSFSDYLDLKSALDSGDDSKVKHMLSSYITNEGNAYTAARQSMSDSPMNDMAGDEDMDLSALGMGDEVSFGGSTARINDVDKLGGTTTLNTNDGHQVTVSNHQKSANMDYTDKNDAMDEIERIKKMAGIESDSSLGEEIGSPTPMSCKAMSRDGSTTPNQIIKRHRKKSKPGPNKGAKYKK